MLTGLKPKPLSSIAYYQDKEYIETITGNLFDGDKTYSMNGFLDETTVNTHSNVV